jgi:LysM repeat protein
MKTPLRTIALASFLLIAATAFAADLKTHALEKGETLYSISKKYQVPYEALAAANGVTDPTKLKTGTLLVIPSVHIVAKGETLYGISRQFGVSVNELLAANKLSSGYVLKIGDVLVIPGGKAPESSATTVASVPPPPTTSSTAKAADPAPLPTTTVKAATASTASTAAPVTTTTIGNSAQKPANPVVTLPEPVKTQDKGVDMKLGWPAPGKAMYLDGKLEGIMIRVKPGETAKAIASGTVVSAGPSRGFSQVAFIQAKSGYVYVYGGNDSLFIKTGDQISSGKEIGKIGIDTKDGSPIAYFFVFRNGQPIDPALAPRD